MQGRCYLNAYFLIILMTLAESKLPHVYLYIVTITVETIILTENDYMKMFIMCYFLVLLLGRTICR